MNRSSSILRELLGENTTTGDVAPVMCGAPMISGPNARRLKRRKRPVVEGEEPIEGDGYGEEDASVIPADAEPLVTEEHPNGQSTTQPASPSVPNESLIPTAVALVAPDCTPDADKPLDQSQVPVIQSAPNPAQAAQPAAPTAPGQPADGGVLRTLVGMHQSTYRPPTKEGGPQQPKAESQATLPSGLTPAQATQQLIAEQKATIFKAKIMEAAASGGGMPAPHHDPNAGGKASAAMRMMLGQ